MWSPGELCPSSWRTLGTDIKCKSATDAEGLSKECPCSSHHPAHNAQSVSAGMTLLFST